jgi:hypothetical protein
VVFLRFSDETDPILNLQNFAVRFGVDHEFGYACSVPGVPEEYFLLHRWMRKGMAVAAESLSSELENSWSDWYVPCVIGISNVETMSG